MGHNSKGVPIYSYLIVPQYKDSPEGSTVDNQQQVNWVTGEKVLALMEQSPAI